jgi:hypothetical protein
MTLTHCHIHFFALYSFSTYHPLRSKAGAKVIPFFFPSKLFLNYFSVFTNTKKQAEKDYKDSVRFFNLQIFICFYTKKSTP